MITLIDHIVIAAPTLESGIAYVHDQLGVMPVPGGSHVKMGTHNYLLKLGDGVYLEVIAPDPGLPAPSRPRWFALDHLKSEHKPRLLTWVARTTDLDAAKEKATVNIGDIETMSRNDLQWRIAVPADGSLLYDGVAPYLIQWEGAAHPATRLTDPGCSLLRIEGVHPDAVQAKQYLHSVGFNGAFQIRSGQTANDISLKAYIQTPAGIRVLA